MPLDPINRGSAPNDGTGEAPYTAFGKVNANETYLEGLANAALTPNPFIPMPSNRPGATAQTWYVADRSVGMLFFVPAEHSYRYVRFNVGVSSGNMRVAVTTATIDPTNDTRVLQGSLIADSGTIAAPTAGNVKLDLGAFTLSAGLHVLLFAADNTTLTLYGSSSATPDGSFMSVVRATVITDTSGLGHAFNPRHVNAVLEEDDGAV